MKSNGGKVVEIKRNILLNPGPSTTTDTVKMAQVVPDICPREKEFVGIMKPMRDDLVRIVHGKLDDYTSVLFCGSGTICIDVALNSLLDEGKTALIVNNGSYSERAVEVCNYYGLPLVEVKQPITERPNLESIEDALKANPDVGYVYITYHETGTGLLNPVREVGALAHKYGAFLITDTTSAYAMIPINVYDDNIDFCMASAQKGIQGMTGLSYIIGRKDIIEQSKDFPKRSYYCNLYMQYEFFEKTGEMHFTPPVQTI
jgi:2-aminoethylphosphonate-pyruvate transaminase